MMKPMFMNVILMVVTVVHPIQLWIFVCSANVMVINYDLLTKRNFIILLVFIKKIRVKGMSWGVYKEL